MNDKLTVTWQWTIALFSMGLLSFYMRAAEGIEGENSQSVKTVFFWIGCYLVAFALSMMVAEGYDDQSRELKELATIPIGEWPDMSLNRFKWLCRISEYSVCEEDVMAYYRKHVRGSKASIKCKIKWHDYSDHFPKRYTMPFEWYEMNDPELIVPDLIISEVASTEPTMNCR